MPERSHVVTIHLMKASVCLALEAMASGIPSPRRTALRCPVVGNAGILLEPHDVAGLTSAMLRIIDDRAFAADLKARGLERARSFTWERCASRTMRSWEHAARESSLR
jgi:glycosyltransferase involved in cell wall biosynthesis